MPPLLQAGQIAVSLAASAGAAAADQHSPIHSWRGDQEQPGFCTGRPHAIPQCCLHQCQSGGVPLLLNPFTDRGRALGCSVTLVPIIAEISYSSHRRALSKSSETSLFDCRVIEYFELYFNCFTLLCLTSILHFFLQICMVAINSRTWGCYWVSRFGVQHKRWPSQSPDWWGHHSY